MDCSPSGSSVHEIFQAAILERVAISYPRGSSWPSDRTCVFWVSCIGFFHHCATWESQKCVIVQSLSCVWLFVTLRTTAHKAPLSSTISQSFLRFMSVESVMLSDHPVLCSPIPSPIFSFCLQSFPASGSGLAKSWLTRKDPDAGKDWS